MNGSRLAGWGRLSAPGRETFSEDLERATKTAVLCRGLGRSYGDSALPPPSEPVVLNTTLADRLLAFDDASGVLRAEAGASVESLNQRLLPLGWFVPVTPGTQFVTLGGAVAADVHGKNHHVHGCFGAHVRSLRMRVPSGDVLRTSPDQHADLFWATVGGMGLTGHILDVEVGMHRVRSPWIWQETTRVNDIDAYIDALKNAAARFPFTVGWIEPFDRTRAGSRHPDGGRLGDPSTAPSRYPKPFPRVTLPVELPSFVLGRPSVKAFNVAFYWRHLQRKREGITHWQSFFYPLDIIRHWNRMYGKRGFTQYQCVLPESAGQGAARRVLEVLTKRGGASFLCVIKDCGAEGQGLLSFPMRGISIALDIAVRDDTQALVDALNEQVIDEGGRIYLAKDAFTRAEHFRAMEPRLERFLAVRRKWDPELKIRSAQSVRLFGDPA